MIAPDSAPLFRMFRDVPERYDIVNRVLTLGLDAVWRRRAVRTCLAYQPSSILDLCTGTGDFALLAARLAPRGTKITGLDFSQGMLDRAERKRRSAGDPGVEFIRGNASQLPFGPGSFDCVAVSFAFRNLTWKNPHATDHLSEILRVLKPGGRLLIVETSQPSSGLLRGLFHAYLKCFAGPAGGVLSGQKAAYAYLAHSAENYYSPPEMDSLLTQAGFQMVSSTPLLFGAIAITTAVR